MFMITAAAVMAVDACQLTPQIYCPSSYMGCKSKGDKRSSHVESRQEYYKALTLKFWCL